MPFSPFIPALEEPNPEDWAQMLLRMYVRWAELKKV